MHCVRQWLSVSRISHAYVLTPHCTARSTLVLLLPGTRSLVTIGE